MSEAKVSDKISLRIVFLIVFLPFISGFMAENNQMDTSLIRTLMNKGESWMDSHLDSAMIVYRRAANLLQKEEEGANTFEYAQCITQIAVIHTMKGQFIHALEENQEALSLLERLHTKNPAESRFREGTGVALANIGAIYYHQQNWNKALEYWVKALKIHEELGNLESSALLSNNLGIICFEQKRYTEALSYYQTALDHFSKMEVPDRIAMCYTNISEVYSAQKLFREARCYIEKSMKLKEETGDLPGLVECYSILAELDRNMDDFSASVRDALTGYEIAREIGDSLGIRKLFGLLAAGYASMGDYRNAYEYHIQLKNISDRMFNAAKHKQFEEIQARFETERREQELAHLRQQEKSNRILLWIMLSGIIFILTTSSVIVVLVIKKRRKEIGFKTRQLTTTALNLMQKNRMLQEMAKTIDGIASESPSGVKTRLDELREMVHTHLKTEKDWGLFRLYFEEVSPDFFSRLNQIDASLNHHELRQCALIKLNFNIKETASVLNLAPNSIKSARHRLKKKLRLKPEDDLYAFIRKL